MELYFPVANFIQAHTSFELDLGDLPERIKALQRTASFTVYGSADFDLVRICTLDELRFVSDLLCGLYIGRVALAMKTEGLENKGTTWAVEKQLLPYFSGEQDMRELVSEGVSPLLHIASITAANRDLPFHPKIKLSTTQGGALRDLACAGQLAKPHQKLNSCNVFEMSEESAKSLQSSFDMGLEALKKADLALPSRHEKLIRQVLAVLPMTKTLLVLNKEKL